MKKMILLVLVVLLMVFFAGCQESKKLKTNSVDDKQAAEGKAVSNNGVPNSTRGKIDKSEIKTGPFNPQVSKMHFPIISYNREISHINNTEGKFLSFAKISTRGEVKGIDATITQKDLSCSPPDYFQLITERSISDKIYFPIASIAEISGVPGSNIISIENGLRIHLSKELYCNIFIGDNVVNWSDGHKIFIQPPILKDSQIMMDIQNIALLLSDSRHDKRNMHPLLKAEILAESGLENEHIVGVVFYFFSLDGVPLDPLMRVPGTSRPVP